VETRRNHHQWPRMTGLEQLIHGIDIGKEQGLESHASFSYEGKYYFSNPRITVNKNYRY